MRFASSRALASLLLIATATPLFGMPRLHRGPTSPKLFKARSSSKPAAKPASSGISQERATQIQTALIKSGYMNGEPTGVWDSTTQAAMEKMQADNGWQTKLVPDSRAIIKLGLGPSSTAPGMASSGAEASAPVASEANSARLTNQ